jgi:transcriptional regulator with XRE-family HTH domain
MENTSTIRKKLLESFSKKLKDVVFKANIKYNALELELGLGKGSITNYTSGTSLCSVEALVLLSQRFNVSCDELLGLKSKPSSYILEEPKEFYGAPSNEFLQRQIEHYIGKVAICEKEKKELQLKLATDE